MALLSDQKKAILPYLQRAEEITSLNPKVAYYCRVYAIQQGIQIENRLPEIDGVLEALMEKLEQDKPKLNITKEDAQECEAFAVTVFNRADRQDRAGKADLRTVKAFYVATIFIDILRQFGELPADMVERQQYAAWKAADIRKALREGRTPQAGPPPNDDGLDLPDIPDLKHDRTDPTIPSTSATLLPGPASSQGGIGGASSEPGSPQRGGQNAANLGPPSPQRFRPGSKVFFNTYDGAPVKGTVVTIHPSQYGNLCQVGLSQKVVEVPENRLAFDFEQGDLVIYSQTPDFHLKGTVERGDASSWPVAYLIRLESGQTLPTTEDKLAPAEKLTSPANPHLNTPPAPPKSNLGAANRDAPPSLDFRQGSNEGSPSLSHAMDQPEKTNGQPDVSDEVSASHDMQDATPQEHTSHSEPGPSQVDGARFPDIDYSEPSSSHTPPVTGAFMPPPEGPSQSQPGFPNMQTGASQGHYPDLDHTPATTQPPYHEGRSDPPPFEGDQNQKVHHDSQEGEGISGSFNRTQPPNVSVPGPSIPYENQPQVPPQPSGMRQVMQQNSSPQLAPPYQPPLHSITEAQKYSKYAASSLGFEDVPTAMKYLQQAMDLLKGPSHAS